MSTLDVVSKKHVIFDPNDKDHLQAFHSFYFKGKQHPTLRFTLEEGYSSVVTMAQNKIINTFIQEKVNG